VPAASAGSSGHSDAAVDSLATASPIKHVIIIISENRSFDRVYGTYVAKRSSEGVWNLLSQKIVDADGMPGPNFARAHQYRINTAPNGGKFFASADLKDKVLFSTLPPPDVAGLTAEPPNIKILKTPGGDPGLPAEDEYLLGTGGTDLSFTLGPTPASPMSENCLPGASS
jgi:phospholipase C